MKRKHRVYKVSLGYSSKSLRGMRPQGRRSSPPTPLCGWQPVCTQLASTCRHEQRSRRVPVCAGRPRHARAGARGVHQRLYAVYYLSKEDVRLIAVDTKLADRTAAQHASNPTDTAVPTASDTTAPKAPASKGKSSPAPHDSASPQRSRSSALSSPQRRRRGPAWKPRWAP